MTRNKLGRLAGVASVWILASCGGSTSLVVIPNEVEQMAVPEGKYKDVPAVYLYEVGYAHFDPIDIGNTYYPSYVFTHSAKVKLLTRAATEADHWGKIPIHHVGNLINLEALVIKKSGEKKALGKGDFLSSVVVKNAVRMGNSALDLQETVIAFPGLEPGDVIQYKYTKRGRVVNWQFNHVDAPVMYSKFMLARPLQRAEIQPLIFNRHDLKIESSVEKMMTSALTGYTGLSLQHEFDVWTARDIPAIRAEAAMPPLADLASRLMVWQGDSRLSWSDLGAPYYKWFTHYNEQLPRARAKALAEPLIKGLTSPLDQARAIQRWVKDTVSIQGYSELSWVPRTEEIGTIDLEAVLKEKHAFPEQVASLLWLMLDSVGIHSSVVLANHRSSPPAEENLPTIDQFSYVLLALPDGTLLDTTDRLCPLGFVPWEFEGTKALWLKPDSAVFKSIPSSAPGVNKRVIDIIGTIKPEGEAEVVARYNLKGLMGYAYRRWLVSMSDKEKQEAIRGMITAASESAEVDGFEVKQLEKFEEPLDIIVTYKIPRYAVVLKDKMEMKLGAFVHHVSCPDCFYPSSPERTNPVMFPFKRLDEINVDLSFPANALLRVVPKGFRTKELESGTAIGVQTSYGSTDGKSLQVQRKLSINDLLVGKEGFGALRNLIGRYLEQKDTLISLELTRKK